MQKVATVILALFSFACSKMPEYDPDRNYENKEKELLTRFIMAKDSTVIELDEGNFLLSKPLILEGVSHVTIRGKGIDKTVLSFKGQKEGAEGMRIANCKNITLEDFSVEDAAGDNIKVTDTEGITLRKIRSAWTGKVSEENGAYGLYPVLCRNVLIENCEVLGASDAGIYVGQSEQVVVRNNKVYWNVAGIESENSEKVEIYGNEATENSGGILIFDLPGLTRYGKDIQVFDNTIYENNLKNFAPSGNIVAMVPAGTGLLILATRNVEVRYNVIRNNKTVGAGIISYVLVDAMSEDEQEAGGPNEAVSSYRDDPNYDPYPQNIYLHNNEYENTYKIPDLSNDFGKLFLMKFGIDIPDVVWDGIIRQGSESEHQKICVKEDEKVKKVNLDAGNDFKGLTENPEIFNCDVTRPI